MSDADLSFTGERFLPSCEREIWYEHYHRYAMALSWVEGKNVLDAACGEGYGSHLLATQAQSVIGVDISNQAIQHANRQYSESNLNFIQSDVLQMDFEDGTFDVVVSFETLEHLAEHEALIKDFKRVLKPDGVLIISTPDKMEYSDKTGFENEYHVKELYKNEFAELVEPVFKYCQWYGQKLMFTSTIWHLNRELNSIQFDCMDEKNQIKSEPLFNPMYFILVASNIQPNSSSTKDCFNFSEQRESVYGHYNAVIRAHINAEKECEKLENKLKKWQSHPIIGRCIKWFGME